jgi:hypothetical protein
MLMIVLPFMAVSSVHADSVAVLDPDSQERYDRFNRIYDVVNDVHDQAHSKWLKLDTCSFFCPSNPGEDIANNMTIQYSWLSKIVDARRATLKYQLSIDYYTRADQLQLAEEQLKWSNDFEQKANSSRSYIWTLSDAYLWKQATLEVAKAGQRGVAYFKQAVENYKNGYKDQ